MYRFGLGLFLLLTLMISGCNEDTSSPPDSDSQAQNVTTPNENQQPTASITAPQTFISGETVSLDGSHSSDPDGDSLSYQWAQTAGPDITVTGASTATLSFVVPTVTKDTRYTFQLTVQDDALTSSANLSFKLSPAPSNPNQQPVAMITASKSFISGADVTLDGNGSFDPDGDPLSYQWSQTEGLDIVLPGTQSDTLSFVAPTVSQTTAFTFQLTVDDGELSSKASVRIKVLAPKTPEAAVPGMVEAENYDAFFDTTAGNTGGVYRQDDVDIEEATDQSGGFYVGWTASGEYLRYNINVSESGDYQITLRAASTNPNNQIQVKLDDEDVSGTLVVPNSDDWQNLSFTTRLAAGAQQLEVYFVTGGINFDYIDLAKADDAPPTPAGWKLVWSDEFNGDSIDLKKWEHEVNAYGGGNNELQYYTARTENSWVSDGVLHIQAKKERYTDSEGTRRYTSARLRTLNKGDWKYGRFEVHAKLPYGQGMWPAIWMLPSDSVYGGWAASGEIDIMEAINLEGTGGNVIYGTLHYGDEWPNNIYTGDHMTPSTSVVDEFHTYALEWEENEIRWYIDGFHYQTQNKWHTSGEDYPAPFNQEFHMIMNLAVGGSWPGNPDGSTEFPQSMEVDYVRVYQKE